MPSYIYGCGSFQDIRPRILVFWAFGRGYEPLLISLIKLIIIIMIIIIILKYLLYGNLNGLE
jgi:hypothetical protein